MKNIELDFFPGGVKHCITLSYDDGRIEDERLVSLFNKYGLRATFHLCCDDWTDRFEFLKESDAKFVDPTKYAELYKGHEISCHLAHHPFIYKLPKEALVMEIYTNKIFLEKLCNYPVRGMSYPFGSPTEDAIVAFKATGMEYARLTGEDNWYSIPADPMKWTPTCHHDRAYDFLDDFWYKGPASLQKMKLMNIWGHSYEINNEEKWEYIERLCADISGRDDVWYATNIEVIDYINAMRQIRFTSEMTVAYNPTATNVWIGVDGKPVEIPAGATVTL